MGTMTMMSKCTFSLSLLGEGSSMEHNIAYQYAILTEITYQKII